MLSSTLAKSLLCTAVLVLLVARPAHSRVIEQIVTVINGEPYTRMSLATYAKAKMARDFPTGSLDNINVSDREVLEQFITDKLIEAEIRAAGIRITEQDVNFYIDQIKQKNRLTDAELKLALTREGQTLESYRASVRTELEKSELIDRQVRKKINITNDDVERYYKLNAANYRTDERARIRHILVGLPENASPEEVSAATVKAGELYNRIISGEDFGTLAKQYSQGAGWESGGDIGWVKRGSLLKPIEDMAFAKLAVGQVSRPVRSSMGVHLVKLEERERGTPLPLAAVAPKIKEELYVKAVEERFSIWLKTDVRRRHTVDVKIAGVVFKPEDSKEDTRGVLMAKSSRLNSREERGFLSYLNPLSYIIKEAPVDQEEQQGALAGKNIVSVFGVPLFASESVDDAPDVLSSPAAPVESAPESSERQGFFSSIVDRLNPFKR